jgi:hypothetical protein
MAIHGKGSKIIKDGFNLSCYLQDASVDTTISSHDTSTMCDEYYKTFIPGIEEFTVSGNGFFDGDPDKINEIIQSKKWSVDNIWTLFRGSDAIGNSGEAFTGLLTAIGVQQTYSDLIKMTLSGSGTGELFNVVSLMPLSTKTTTYYSTPVDNLASSASGGVCFIQLEAVTGGTCYYDIEDSADNVSFATIAAGDLITDLTSIRHDIAGTIRRYVRVTVTIGGGKTFRGQVSLARL